MEVGDARGWNVWPLETGEWAWNAWIAANGGLPQAGIESTEIEAQEAAKREIERMLFDAEAAAPHRRELPVRDDDGIELFLRHDGTPGQ